MKKWWIKILLVLAAVVLVVSILIATSGVHSKNAVERYKDQLRAAGEKLELDELIPPRVDPDKNALDLYAQAFNLMGPMNGMLSSNPPPAMKMVAPGKAVVGWRQNEIVEDSTTPCTNTWEDLDKELRAAGPALDLLRQGAERPELNFELNYSLGANLPLPHLGKMKQTALLLAPAVLADLHRGDSASAATNLHTLLRVLNQWTNEPLPISQLIRGAIEQIAAPAQWELLQATNASDEQLAMLQRDWANLQWVQSMESSMVFERAWMGRTIQQLRSSNSPSSIYAGYMASASGGGSSGSGDWWDGLKEMRDAVKHRTADTLWRVSWSYDDELRTLEGNQVLVATARQVRTNGYFKDAFSARDRSLAALGLNRPGTNWLRNNLDDVLESVLGGESVQSNARLLERVMNFEVTRVIAGAAIAVKRYQLRHGTPPPDLNALVLEFLPEVPRDAMDGKPLRYKLNADGTFLLYSIGVDGVDNGGDPSPPTGTKSFQWQRGKDWVWPQAVP